VNRFLLIVALLLAPPQLLATVHAASETFHTSDNVTLHYFQAGPAQGPALVMIPGWTMAADIFEPQINELSKRFHVIALDPRSQGDSQKTPDGNYLERRAADLQELIDHLHLKDITLLGWSNGVPDVLMFVDQYGDANLHGIILVDGFVNYTETSMPKMVTSMMQSLQMDRAKFTDGFVRSMYSTKQSEEYIEHVKQTALKTPTNTAIVLMWNVLSRGDYLPILKKTNKPLLYICEPYLEPHSKIVQAAQPKAQVEVFKNAAHALFVDEPDHFNKVVSDFMDGKSTTDATSPNAL
jgi:non-heme chloroperoxidase